METLMAEVSVTDVTWSIQKLGYAATDPRMDGYYQWGQKQKLYQILWETQRQLKNVQRFMVKKNGLLTMLKK
jgi:hypothetical protein